MSEFNNKFSDFMLVMTVVVEIGFVVYRYCLVKFYFARTVRIFYVAPI